MQHSIFKSGFRSFFIAFFSVIGICFAILAILIVTGVILAGVGPEPEMRYKVEIQPNAKGIRKVVSKSAPVILRVNINGIIGTEFLNSEIIRGQLIESREGVLKNDRVKGILLHINTPGGAANDSDTIYRLIRAYKEQYSVPVFAFVDGMCASGGMYVACAADKIFATTTSMIGSVGVVTGPIFNFTGGLDKIGVDSLVLSAGKGKADLSPFKKWEPGEQEEYQKLIDYFYTFFVQLVASDRPKLTKEKLEKEVGARLFYAEEATEIGFIDGYGFSLRKTLEMLLAELGIEDDYYQVVQMRSKSWISEFVRGEVNNLKGITPFQFDANMQGKILYLHQHGK